MGLARSSSDGHSRLGGPRILRSRLQNTRLQTSVLRQPRVRRSPVYYRHSRPLITERLSIRTARVNAGRRDLPPGDRETTGATTEQSALHYSPSATSSDLPMAMPAATSRSFLLPVQDHILYGHHRLRRPQNSTAYDIVLLTGVLSTLCPILAEAL
ncbi:hypothetical protein OH76DRAFT_4422 [Lentinus brumalis]|uniref:Uncharacterized protein n=1 Tax=Lentinus brumalis TaxID=2498619 RepID=A0A371DWU0_9APHY|nr:hypothetical protein OH76DRAFT_4422 [Polyporus brumalis]